MSEYPDRAWLRLGRLLQSRRVHIDPAYANRLTFCSATGLNYKLVQEVERAKRRTFTDVTFALFEAAYRLTSGSIRRTLAGGDLEPTEVADASLPPEGPEEEDQIDIDLETFVPESPAEKALMAIYRAHQRAADDRRTIEEQLRELHEKVDLLTKRQIGDR